MSVDEPPQYLAAAMGASVTPTGLRRGRRRRASLAYLPFLAYAVFSLIVVTLATASLVPAAYALQPVTFATEGSGSGQISNFADLAVDQSSGTVVVADENNFRIDEFSSGGAFIRAFGYGVLDGIAEPQVCTTICQQGTQGSAPGELHPTSVVIDDEGDIYVSDAGQHRVEEFSGAGELMLIFGGEVNKTTGADVCTAIDLAAGDTCEAGVAGSGEGQFNYEFPAVAVDQSDHVWVGDENRLEEFGSSGAFISQIALPGTGEIHSLAAGSSGDLYFIGSQVQGVQRIKPDGTPFGAPYPLDSTGHPRALGLDPATEHLFVSDQLSPEGEPTPATLLEYDSSGVLTESFGTGSVAGHPQGNALAFGDSAERLYLVGSENSLDHSAAQIFTPPEPGPLPEEGSELANPFGKTTATLRANVNPEGAVTTVHFQYVDQRSFETEGGFAGPHTQTTVESGSIGEDFSEHPVSVQATGLSPEATYRFRVVSTNADGTIDGQGASFTTEPPLRIDSTSVTEVTATGAAVTAQVNPLGDPASYHFEYLTAAEYEADRQEGSDGFTGVHAPTDIPIPDAAITAGESDTSLSQHLINLMSSTAYRYRIVVSNALHPVGIHGPARAFTTQSAGGVLTLPDGRAWELVSPADKQGGGVSYVNHFPFSTLVQAAADGHAIVYGSPVAFADPVGSPAGNQYFSGRGRDGWSTENIGIPVNSQDYRELLDPPYKAFSTDLSVGLLAGPTGIIAFGSSAIPPPEPLPGTEAAPGFGNFYLRDENARSYRSLLTETQLGDGEASLPFSFQGGDVTSDLKHVVLVEEERRRDKARLVEWSEGLFQPVSVLPGKTTAIKSSEEPRMGGGEGRLEDPRAISADGTRAVWETNNPERLYLRENIGGEPAAMSEAQCSPAASGACTVEIDAPQGGSGKSGEGYFLAAAADDSQVFFADSKRLTADSTTSGSCDITYGPCGDLYRFEPGAPAGQRLTDLTVDHADPNGADALGVVGVSDDGSYVYFVANGVLAANEGVDGTHAGAGDCPTQNESIGQSCNLYLLHEGKTTFIATLSGKDDNLDLGTIEPADEGAGDWLGQGKRTARLSADGTRLLFVSERNLTGYDNTAANGHCVTSEQANTPPPCAETFLYEAPTGEASAGRLRCVSCNPTGARPLGLSGIPEDSRTGNFEYGGEHQLRALSSDGRRAFFDSYDALVPQDTNGRLDVYEWEETGVGDCSESITTYSSASGGCVSLISSGTSSEDSQLMDASESGDDVFFRTGESLVSSDPGSVDLYDARMDGGFPEPPAPLGSCEGDACQIAQPVPIDLTPASSIYSGPGNQTPQLTASAQSKHKAKAKKTKKKAKKKGHKGKKGKRANTDRRAGR